MYSYGPPHMAKQKQDDQLEHTYSSYVRIRDVVLKTCQRRWMIGRSGERGSGISVIAAWHDHDDVQGSFNKCFCWVVFIYIYIYIKILWYVQNFKMTLKSILKYFRILKKRNPSFQLYIIREKYHDRQVTMTK